MIVVTGAGGFIGSVVVKYLNDQKCTDIAVVDSMPHPDQFKNLVGKKYAAIYSNQIDPNELEYVTAVVHIGADSSTLTKDWNSIYKTNIEPTRKWYKYCQEKDIPFIFTSSAAVYGNGAGPLNQYALSKLSSEYEIPNAIILRLFNVYGPNEYHKGRMASTIMHWHTQLVDHGSLTLFENSGDFSRDFIHVEDVAKVIHHFINSPSPGVYDVGTGKAVTFLAVANIVNEYLPGNRLTIPMPADIVSQYQPYTCANLNNLSYSFNTDQFRSVSQGIPEYLGYLKTSQFY